VGYTVTEYFESIQLTGRDENYLTEPEPESEEPDSKPTKASNVILKISYGNKYIYIYILNMFNGFLPRPYGESCNRSPIHSSKFNIETQDGDCEW